jgi:leader peptidase (prepilin peptidase)/N-methyltransferase
MFVFFYILLFIFGTAVGSFVGVVVDRLSSKEAIWKGRSHCDHCRHTLHIGDLVPLVSFVVLKAKCRYCHKKLSWFYPLIELCTGIAYVFAGYTVFQHSGVLLSHLYYQMLAFYYFAIIGALIVIFFADLRYGIIPFKAVAFSFVIATIWALLLPSLPFTALEVQLLSLQPNFITILLSGLVTGGFFLCIFFITKGRGIGFGDVVYAFLMGFLVGFPNVLISLYIAFVTGAIISLILVGLRRKRFKGGTIPFGPFLVLGTMVILLWGNTIFSYILKYFTN